MSTNRRTIFLLCFLLLLTAVSGCSKESSVRKIKVAHGLDQFHPVHKAMVYLADVLKEKSGGSMQVSVYPSQQLGTERECLELLQIGSLGMTKVSSSVLEGFVPDFKVFSLPYIFRDDNHKFRFFESEAGRELLRSTESFWLRGLCYYDAGSRSFYTKTKPVIKPDDLKGMKIRTQESPTSVRLVNAMGGSATPIAWGELYTALQQGVVDGAENNPPSFYSSRHYEVCKYYSLDEHTSVPDVLLISTVIWNDLSDQEKKWLQEAADESYEYQKVLWQEATMEALEEVQKAGVKIYYPDKKLFVEKTEALVNEFGNEPAINKLINKIQEFSNAEEN